MMATAFMGYVLPWDRWLGNVTNLFSAIPLLETVITWLWGGWLTTRFFNLHYLFPFIIVGLVILHIWALHVPGNNNPAGIDIKKPSKVQFHIHHNKRFICSFNIFNNFFWFYLLFTECFRTS